MRALPQAARFYLVGLWCTALLASLGSLFFFHSRPIAPVDILSALIFAGMITLADMASFELEEDRALSIAIAILIAGITALNWPLMLAVVVVGTLSAALARDISWWQMLSIMSVRAISAIVAAAIASLHLNANFLEPGVGNLP